MIPLSTQHYAMLARNLLYTGLTRGRRLVVLLGQRQALAIAVRNQAGRRRWSRLREWLAGQGRRHDEFGGSATVVRSERGGDEREQAPTPTEEQFGLRFVPTKSTSRPPRADLEPAFQT